MAKCIIGSKIISDVGINCNYALDKCSQAYGETVTCFRNLAKYNILHSKFTQKDSITSNKYSDGNPGYILYVFDVRHHQIHSSAQPIKVKFDFRPAVPATTDLIGYAHLLSNKLLWVSSYGQRHFDLV